MTPDQQKALQTGIELAASGAARLAQVKSQLTHKAVAAMEARTGLNAQARVTRGLAWAEIAEEYAREATAKFGEISDGVLAGLIESMADDLIEKGIHAIDLGIQKKARLANDAKLGVTRK